jgi:glycolate oxidase FAD binding subunit
VPSTAQPFGLPGEQLTEWFGSQRWVCTAVPSETVHDVAALAHGHAQAFVSTQVQPMADAAQWSSVQRRLHSRVQQSFDPDGVFQTGRKWSTESSAAVA